MSVQIRVVDMFVHVHDRDPISLASAELPHRVAQLPLRIDEGSSVHVEGNDFDAFITGQERAGLVSRVIIEDEDLANQRQVMPQEKRDNASIIPAQAI